MEHKEKKRQENKGITLIALVVTITVLMILATVSINAVLGDNGIIKKAKQAKEMYSNSIAKDNEEMDTLLNEMAKYNDVKEEASKEEGITATVDGKTVTITKDNVATYLGRVVSNYKPTATTVAVGGTTYTVSNNYRLYYVDFDKKYNKDEVSVFLKADCTSNNYTLPVTDTTASTADNVKIKALNPSLYNQTGVTAPAASQENIKAVTFLTNTSNWNSLKTGASLADKVNYVVGAPSVEMMMDSYNTKYGLTDETMNTGTLTADTKRAKLFYQYPTTINSNNYGYEVGPSNNSSAKNGYYYWTSDYSVKTDSAIDSMYYPGSSNYYWLASTSALGTTNVLYVDYGLGGRVDHATYYSSIAFCPLVSLKSSASLELQ